MSKRFKGKTCVYCTVPGSSEIGDHVIAREFFPRERRSGLPIVPACEACNNEKSKLELYATAVVPFGGTHADADAILSTMVEPRLSKNAKLAKSLAEGTEHHYTSSDGGRSWDVQMVLPFDGERLARLFQMITRGLVYWEWGWHVPGCVGSPHVRTGEGGP
jgi:hypothetical protein